MSSAGPRLTRGEFLAAFTGVFALAGGAAANPQAGGQGQSEDVTEKLRFPRAIVLVRHAEKAAEGGTDPALSPAGVQRAERLAQMLAASGVTHLFATEFIRTRTTLEPLSKLAQRPVSEVSARDPKALLSALESLPRGALAVVAGHSNTVPALVERMSGGRSKPTIDESEYDRLFLVVQWGTERGEQLALELRY